MNFSSLTNQKFTERFKNMIQEERRITAEVLIYFREAEKRMHYAEYGYSSLIAFAIHELKYSESDAARRISAMRMMKEIPEVKDKIQTGELSLSTLTQASTFMKLSEKQTQEKMTVEDKRNILKSIEGQSSQKAERTLLELNPDLKPVTQEKHRAQAHGATQVITTLDAELMKQLEEIQVLLGKKMQIKDLLKYLAEEQLQNLRRKSQRGAKPMAAVTANSSASPNASPNPDRGARKPPSSSEISTKNFKRPFISIHIKRELLNKTQYQCCYVDPISKKRCQEKHYLQFEHVAPKAFGGSDDISNLEVLCSTHNKLRAMQKLGVDTMKNFIPSLM